MIGFYEKNSSGTVLKEVCKACGHTHIEYCYGNGTQIGEPFIRLGTTGCYKKNGSSEFRLLACPKCGTVHIEV